MKALTSLIIHFSKIIAMLYHSEKIDSLKWIIIFIFFVPNAQTPIPKLTSYTQSAILLKKVCL